MPPLQSRRGAIISRPRERPAGAFPGAAMDARALDAADLLHGQDKFTCLERCPGADHGIFATAALARDSGQRTAGQHYKANTTRPTTTPGRAIGKQPARPAPWKAVNHCWLCPSEFGPETSLLERTNFKGTLVRNARDSRDEP